MNHQEYTRGTEVEQGEELHSEQQDLAGGAVQGAQLRPLLTPISATTLRTWQDTSAVTKERSIVLITTKE